MKKLLAIGSLFGVLMIGLWAASAAPANFAGTWVLDKSKSESLPRNWENAESVTLVVTQDDKQLTYETKIVGGGGPGGGPGGGGRGGGMSPTRSFKLDGSETTSEMPGGRGTATLKAKWQSDGKILELTSVTKGNFQGNEFTSTTQEHWELADGGKTLKVHRKSESPQGTRESKLTFTKK